MSDVPPGTSYKGPSGIARDSAWLTNEDLPHEGDTVLTIKDVLYRKAIKFQAGREERNKLALAFVERKRELVLNSTNRKVLNALFGTDTTQWYGKKVALFVAQGVRRPDGTVGPAVRVRPKRMAEATAPSAVDPVDADFEAEARRAEERGAQP